MTTATDDEEDRRGTVACRECGGVEAPGVSECFCEGNHLRAKLAAAEVRAASLSQELLAAEARCHDLERQRTEFDCRFVGRYAEMSGSHCPPGEPCQRCRLEAAEARVAELEARASFGASLLSEWWENDCGDLDGAFVQDETEKYGLWHHVERHADGVECEWCCGEEPCGELTEAGERALAGGGK